MTGTTYGIVAGYDGSPGAEQAVRWAAREARFRGTTLTVCLAWTPDHLELPAGSPLSELARRHGQEVLARILPYAESVLGPDLVRPDLAAGSAAQVLCERSRTADMVVVGGHGHSELPGLLLGSVPWQVAGNAAGRIVVVRGAEWSANRSPGPVVVGADGSAAGQAAVVFAFEEAALRDVPLVAVCALTDTPCRLGDFRRVQEDYEHTVATEAKEHPKVSVIHEVLPGSPRTALLAAAPDPARIRAAHQGRAGPGGPAGLPGPGRGRRADQGRLRPPVTGHRGGVQGGVAARGGQPRARRLHRDAARLGQHALRDQRLLPGHCGALELTAYTSRLDG